MTEFQGMVAVVTGSRTGTGSVVVGGSGATVSPSAGGVVVVGGS